MESCAKATIGRHFIPKPAEPAPPVEQAEVIWRVKCKQCIFAAENIKSGNAAEAIANAHSAVHSHDVAVKFDIFDCLMTVVRAEELR